MKELLIFCGGLVVYVFVLIGLALFGGFAPPENLCKCDPCRCCEGEVFIGSLAFGGGAIAVTSKTEAIYNGKKTPYLEIPDDTTELIEIGIDLKRKVATRVVYRTKKDI